MCACGIAYISYVPVLHCTHLGVQVPPAARADMEAFKEHSLYPHIHARQAEDYQACAYHLLPTCSHLLPRVLTHLLLTTMRTCPYSCMLYSYSQTQADVSLTATRRVRSSRERAYLPTNLLTDLLATRRVRSSRGCAMALSHLSATPPPSRRRLAYHLLTTAYYLSAQYLLLAAIAQATCSLTSTY